MDGGKAEYLVEILAEDKDSFEYQVLKLEKEGKVKHIDIHKFPLEEMIKMQEYSHDPVLVTHDRKN